MNLKVRINGSPAQFGIMVRQFNSNRSIFEVDVRDLARRFNATLQNLMKPKLTISPFEEEPVEIPFNTNIVYVTFTILGSVSIKPGSSFSGLYGHITAQAIPNNQSILFIDYDEEYEELNQIWNELKAELEKQGFIQDPVILQANTPGIPNSNALLQLGANSQAGDIITGDIVGRDKVVYIVHTPPAEVQPKLLLRIYAMDRSKEPKEETVFYQSRANSQQEFRFGIIVENTARETVATGIYITIFCFWDGHMPRGIPLFY